MTIFDIDEGVRDHLDIETISPIAVWEAMSVPTATTIPWRSFWTQTSAFFASILSRGK